MKSRGKLAKPLDSSLGAQYCKCSFSIYLGFGKKTSTVIQTETSCRATLFPGSLAFASPVVNLTEPGIEVGCQVQGSGSGAFFSKAPETFRDRKDIAKSRTLWLQSRFIHTYLIWREAPFIQEVSGVYTSTFLETDELEMAIRAQNVSGAFEKGSLATIRLELYQQLFGRGVHVPGT